MTMRLTTEESTIEGLRQLEEHLRQTREWLETGVQLHPVYAQRLRQKLGAVRDLADDAWKHVDRQPKGP
jgi:hypothetical protein